MKRDKKTDKASPSRERKLVLERTTVRQLEDQDLERVNGGLCSICGPRCTL